MRRAIAISKDLSQTHTIEDLTEVFESIASLRIAKIRDRVVSSKAFFAELWKTYQSLRVNPREHLARHGHHNDRTVFLAITAEGKLSGGVDEQIITKMLDSYQLTEKTDIMVMGSHGAQQLRRLQLRPVKIFQMPANDINFGVTEVIDALINYKQISVFYETYNSLRSQEIARIELISAVKELSKDIETVETVSSRDYIFEPNINRITEYMESVMFGVALIQVIMESKLAQYANRFNNMSRAKQRASELVDDYKRQYHRAKRAESDSRLQEITNFARIEGSSR